MILVVGSTGLLGGSITRLLLERDGGDGVRVLVRSEEAWRGKGGTVERVRGDLKDADSLVRACENVDTVVTTANSAGRGGRVWTTPPPNGRRSRWAGQRPSHGGMSSAASKKPWAARWTCGRSLPAIPFPGCTT